MSSSDKSAQKVIVMTDNLSKNLNALMKKNGVSGADLAQSLNLPYNTIRRLITGFVTDPRMSTLKLIANYFNVSLDALVGEENPLSYSISTESPKTVPILKWSDIVDPNFLNKLDLTNWAYWQPIALASTESLSKKAYALESKKSMQPRFPSGTIFIVDPEKKPIDGDMVLVRMNETHAVSLRDLIIDPPDWQLLPVIGNSSVLLYNEKKHSIIGIIVLTMIHTRR